MMLQREKKKNTFQEEIGVVRNNLLLIINLFEIETKHSLLMLWWIPCKQKYVALLLNIYNLA